MEESWHEMYRRITTPELIAEKDVYMLKFAVTPDEILAAQKLRYRVFNQEQGKGLETSNCNGVDQDEFDGQSAHLVVVHKELNKPIGTYRIILGQFQHSCSPSCLYSSREYHLDGLNPFLSQTLEVGRSCVDPAYRNGTVVALLWTGISEVMARSRMRYLVGCVSLEDIRPEAAWALYEYFEQNQIISGAVHALPQSPFVLPRPERFRIEAILSDERQIRTLMPPLLKGYLRMGGKICGEPAYDYEFGTIDYLILLDVAHLPGRYNRHFNVRTTAEEKTAL